MAIHFANPGNIELDAVTTMGVNVKENDNPIGYFGTGLKYAIATLLRTGHSVTLKTDGTIYQFHSRPKEIRGKEFGMVFMNDQQLGFTIDLGKNWEVWHAYRELYSNCMDEHGTVSGVAQENDTVITVAGPDIANVHADRGKIFLQGEPWLVGDGIEVHRGKSQYLYYRGIRVHKLKRPSRLTYNITTEMRLTEDRTLASEYDAQYKIATKLPRIPNKDLAIKLVDPKNEDKFYEEFIDWSQCWDVSEEFLDGVEMYFNNAKLSETARNMVKKARKKEDFVEFMLDASQAQTATEACVLLKKLNCNVRPSDYIFVEFLGEGIMALAKDGRMYITRELVASGAEHLARGMYEEWLHVTMGYFDESRGMQNFLFNKLFELIQR